MLEIRNLTKHYQDILALDHVSFTLNDRERVSVTGESGCGKTTLLRVIAGLTEADEGEILYQGKPLPNTPHERHVAMAFQDSTLFDHMSVRENILFGSPLKDRRERQAQSEELAEAFEIKDLLDRYPNQISGGQKRRVALARAIACQREILLLDEPFANLDKEGKTRVIQTVKTLCENRCAILLVTHSREEAELLTERHLIMEEGRLLDE